MTQRRFAVVETPISAVALRDLVVETGSGGLCMFEGTVRDHTGGQPTAHLEYEAYVEMAEKIFAEIGGVAAERWEISGIAIHHRVGRVEIGEASVAIAVAAEHRAAAFEACRFAIDALKQSAPIWKKEFGPDGSFWVEGPMVASVDALGGAGSSAEEAAEADSNR